MSTFILWFASFISSPGAGTWIQASSPSFIPLVAPGDCPSSICGDNGTRLSGLARELAYDVRAITLPSGELVTLR
jgi:hypothetical protein